METEEDTEFADLTEYYDPNNRKFVRLDKALIDERPMVFLNIDGVGRVIKFLVDLGATDTFICVDVLQGIEYSTNNKKIIRNSTGIETETYGTFLTKIFIEDQEIDYEFLVHKETSQGSLREGIIGWNFFVEFGCNFEYGTIDKLALSTKRREKRDLNDL